jgi:hypothetical protein
MNKRHNLCKYLLTAPPLSLYDCTICIVQIVRKRGDADAMGFR